ncbi:MAG: sortase [candidate division WWE3 bacterium]|nr:sortase [candidate division WWE3 bacterium]
MANSARISRGSGLLKSAHPDHLMLNLTEEIRRIDWKLFAIKLLSNILILGALVYSVSSFWDVIRQEALYAYWNLRGQKFTVDEIKEPEKPEPKGPFGALIQQPTPLKVEPKSTQFGIVIEKLGVNAPVVADVSVTDKRAYLKALETGVAHAQGTARPGQIGNTYLFAHSSLDFWNYGPYSGVFNLLRKLEVGNRIVVFYSGERFDYYVTEKQVVSGFNTNPLTRTFATPHLTLQTCDPPGTALNRLIITAELR